jgi:uncharacterized membrane protein YkvA (DUF1232 family)
VEAYLEALPEAARVHEFLDVGKARSVGARCLRLIDTLTLATPESAHRAIQAAVLYFVLDDDAESDTESVIGFDDDEQIVAAVERILGIS